MASDPISFGTLETPCAWIAQRFRGAHLEPQYIWTHPDGTELVEYRFQTRDEARHVVRIAAEFLRGKSEGDVYQLLCFCGLEAAIREAAGRRVIYVGSDGSVTED